MFLILYHSVPFLTFVGQWVESSDLEPEKQESSPAKYHDAWRALVGAGYVPALPQRIAFTPMLNAHI